MFPCWYIWKKSPRRVKSFGSDKMSVTGPGCSYWLRLWKVGLRPSKNAWQNPPQRSSLQSFLAQSLIHCLCADANLLLARALPNSGRANQPKASALAPFPVSACRLLALSDCQLSAVRPTLPLQTTIKSPLFWAGGEKWEETDAPYTKTRFPRPDSKQHTGSLAVPPQISAWALHWRIPGYAGTGAGTHSYQTEWLKVIAHSDSQCLAKAWSYNAL